MWRSLYDTTKNRDVAVVDLRIMFSKEIRTDRCLDLKNTHPKPGDIA
jgi:hypothetical protein